MRYYIAWAEEGRRTISRRMIGHGIVALVLRCPYADVIGAGKGSVDQEETGKKDVKHRWLRLYYIC